MFTEDQVVDAICASPPANIHSADVADRLYEFLDLQRSTMCQHQLDRVSEISARVERADPRRGALACDVAAYTLFYTANLKPI